MGSTSRMEQIKEMLKAQPDDSFLSYALAMEHIAAGEDNMAEEIFEKLIHRDPFYHATYYHLAKLHERKLESDKAEEVYRKGMKICLEKGERHALSELQSALNEMLYE
jgi:Tfp pilus assembly protein PilF